MTTQTEATNQRAISKDTEETKLREAIETIPAMAWMAGPNGAIQFRNRRWVEYTGLSQIPQLKELRKLLIHPEDLGGIERPVRSHSY